MKNSTQLPDVLKNAKPSKWQERAKEREENSDWKDFCFEVSLRVYDIIKSDRTLSQKWLAEQLEVSPQYVTKLLKGKENLTIQTIMKLEGALGIKLIALAEEKTELKTPLAPVNIPTYNDLIVTSNSAGVSGVTESIEEYEDFILSA
ncbi:MAG: helix-turn-helix transcriptional regulator [Cyclobacteriaceae bacterium]